MIANLTPHPIHIYPADCPDRIELGSVDPILVIEPAATPARLGAVDLGTWDLDGIPVEMVSHEGTIGMPPYAGSMDSHRRTQWYVVALVVALAHPDRGDLLVPYREVRDLTGSVIGCRQLARPV